jgi:hypothetical protein
MAGDESSNTFASDAGTGTDTDTTSNNDSDSERTSIFGPAYKHTIICSLRHSQQH